MTPTTSNINSNIFATNGSTLDGGCETGYMEFAEGGNPTGYGGHGWSHYYYCDGSTWRQSGYCTRGCKGLPTLATNSSFIAGSNIFIASSDMTTTLYSTGGTFHNFSTGATVSPNKSIGSNLFSTSGAIIDAGCINGTTESGTGGNCDGCGSKQEWAHYYYCDGSTWRQAGSCK
jgi:hypothetical protein